MTMPENTDGRLAGRFNRALVTGGSGFIGAHVVRRLVEAGVQVRCLVLPGDAAPSLDGLDVERVTGDITDARVVTAAAKGVDLVFNLAAIYALWLREPAKMYRVNVEGTRAVLRAARAAGVPRVVHTSSIAAVGYLPGREISDEETAFNDWDVANDYIWSKYISELEAFRFAAEGFDVVCASPAFPMGALDIAPTPTGAMIRDVIRGSLPFTVPGGFNAVDVRDVAEGHLLAALDGASGERYILGGTNVEHGSFAAMVAARVGRRPPRITLHPRALTAVGALSEFAANTVTQRPPRFTKRGVAYLAGRYVWFSTAKAERVLGYRPRPLEESVDAAIAWFRGRG